MRLFIGIALSSAERAALNSLAVQAAAAVPGRYVPPALYHMTLAYLGMREQASLAPLCAALAKMCAQCWTFPYTVDRLALFGHGANGILYAGVAACPALDALAARVRQHLDAMDESYDPKPFVPHITLAKKVTPPKNPFPAVTPVACAADALTLYHSTRVGGALAYLPLSVAPFSLPEVCP